jgi:hypothetical protein
MASAFWFVILISIGVVLVTILVFSKRRGGRSRKLNETVRASPQPGVTSRYRGAQPKSPDLPLSPTAAEEQPAAEDIDNNVQFTVYRPSTIVPQLWYTLVAFAHLSKPRPNAPPNEPDPVKEVQRLAAKILSDQPARYEASKLDRGFSVPRKGLLTFVPLVEGCEFNPPTQSILWQKTVHKVEFEMRALPEVDGREVEGQMTVYLGNIILTEVPLRISVDSHYVAPQSQPSETEEASATPYRKIFASYSHQDTEIVEDFENYVRALGDTYLRDVQTLRAGEVWSERLEEMIREASVFQLFWSSKSMPSKFVRQEWEYALSLNRPKFIRPVYWEEPLPETKPDLPPASLKRLHFYKFPGHEPERREGLWRTTALAKSFTITTTATDTLKTDAKGHAEAVYTVTNSTARPVRGMARAKSLGDTKKESLSIAGETERDFGGGATEQFSVSFDAAGAPAGKYPFRLEVASALNPDEDFTEGPTVNVEVAGVTAPVVHTKKGFPKWIIPVILGLVVIIGVVVLILVLSS